jgi:hypothetical protein
MVSGKIEKPVRWILWLIYYLINGIYLKWKSVI